MIVVEVVKTITNEISSIEISGHAKYGVAGQDIVCSAVSTAVYVSVGLLNKTKVQHQFLEDAKKPLMNISILQINDMSNHILENLIDTFKGIQVEYSKYIKIIEKRR